MGFLINQYHWWSEVGGRMKAAWGLALLLFAVTAKAGEPQMPEDRAVVIPCAICMGSVNFIKELVKFKEHFTADWVFDKLIGFCKVIGSLSDNLGAKCLQLANDKHATMVHGVVERQLGAAKLCRNIGLLLKTLGENAPFNIDCI